jgi:hypothetical protein
VQKILRTTVWYLKAHHHRKVIGLRPKTTASHDASKPAALMAFATREFDQPNRNLHSLNLHESFSAAFNLALIGKGKDRCRNSQQLRSKTSVIALSYVGSLLLKYIQVCRKIIPI